MDKPTGGSIYMDTDFPALFSIQLIEGIVDFLHIVIQSRNGNSLDRHYANGILITHPDHIFGFHGDLVHSHRHHAHFDIPIDGEFFPYHLHTARNNEIGVCRRQSLCFAAFLPALQGGDASQHASFGRTDGAGSRTIGRLRRVPQFGDDIDTAPFDFCRLGIFGLIDHIFIHILGHHPAGIIVHPGGHESGQV